MSYENINENIYFIKNSDEFINFFSKTIPNFQSKLNKDNFENKKIVFIFDKKFFNKNKIFFQNFFNGLYKNFFILKIKPSEKNKTIKTYLKIIKYFIKNNLKKDDIFFFFGGGVLLDIAGFISSTYKRGLYNVFFIPTTLISVVDASIGGKNGLNFINSFFFNKTLYKNILGTFNFNYKIIFFPQFLKTLSIIDFISGLFEIIKYGIIDDFSIVETLYNIFKVDKNLNNLQNYKFFNESFLEIIKKSIQIKIKIVNLDPLDKGERKKLNFGHTFGHALENNNIPHGFAVGLGILFELLILFEFFKNYNNLNNNFNNDFISLIENLILKNYSSLIRKDKINEQNFNKIIYLIFSLFYFAKKEKWIKKYFNPIYIKIKKGENIFPLNDEDLIKIFNPKLQKRLIKFFIHDKKL